MRTPQQPQIPDLETEQLIFGLLLSFNLRELGAFAWQEYQRLGRGFVVIDQVQPYAIYVPRSFVTELPGDASHFRATFEQVDRYEPERSFCVYLGNLSEVVSESFGLTDRVLDRVSMAGWFMPAIPPQDCSLNPDLITQIEGKMPLNLLTLRIHNLQ